MDLKCIFFQSVTDLLVFCQRGQIVKILNLAALNCYNQSCQIRSLAKEKNWNFHARTKISSSFILSQSRESKELKLFFIGPFFRKLLTYSTSTAYFLKFTSNSIKTLPLSELIHLHQTPV